MNKMAPRKSMLHLIAILVFFTSTCKSDTRIYPAMLGSAVNLVCRIPIVSNKNIILERTQTGQSTSETVAVNGGLQQNFNNPKYRLVKSGSFYQLTVREVDLRDDGIYKCYYFTENNHESARLNVLGKSGRHFANHIFYRLACRPSPGTLRVRPSYHHSRCFICQLNNLS